MANMSYCRFQNTTKDLRDCDEAGFHNTESIDEAKAALNLYELCAKIVDEVSLAELTRHLKELKEEDAELDDEGAA